MVKRNNWKMVVRKAILDSCFQVLKNDGMRETISCMVRTVKPFMKHCQVTLSQTEGLCLSEIRIYISLSFGGCVI